MRLLDIHRYRSVCQSASCIHRIVRKPILLTLILFAFNACDQALAEADAQNTLSA